MSPVYDYAIAFILLLSVIAYASAQLSSLTRHVSYQYMALADRLIDDLLMSPGRPEDWGVELRSIPERIGLAPVNGSSLDLDPYKVQRLFLNNITYEEASSSLSYRWIRLEIKPYLDIKVELLERTPLLLSFKVTVRDFGGKPVPMAVVKGFLFSLVYSASTGTWRLIGVYSAEGRTDERGECTLEYSILQPEAYVLAIIASSRGFYNLQVLHDSLRADSFGEGVVYGQYLIAENVGPSLDIHVVTRYDAYNHTGVAAWNDNAGAYVIPRLGEGICLIVTSGGSKILLASIPAIRSSMTWGRSYALTEASSTWRLVFINKLSYVLRLIAYEVRT
ncbi:MAG: hypothetical protein DRN15_05900 [Thermoprotei archaeon]|nr:MAG: hypothetical protein DRN15_05900 [Thermoprotei archaeon]RLF23696.1 MAG: hypothetical protein DRM97_04425 [Thermoprotei archaeon]